MDIVDHQHDATTMLGEFQQHPVNHRLPVEVRRRSWRLILDRAGSLTDGVEQGKPEKLCILLVMPHRHRSDAMRLIRAVCPGAQQRCLPAASRRRDDRHLPRCRAVETGEEIVASDHSGSVHATFTYLLLPIAHSRRHDRGLPWPTLGNSEIQADSQLAAKHYPSGRDFSALTAVCEWRAASRASSVRLATPTFAYACERCALTALRDINSSRAMSGLFRPWLASSTT